MSLSKPLLLGSALLACSASGLTASADNEATIPYTTRTSPVVVELFTSQSCSSCPKAEALFNELSTQDDLIAIQWHVDYWDTLVHGRAGKWKDPYSDPANTQRQRNYNYMLRGTGSVYTPQAIVGGLSETTGSRSRRVASLIENAPAAKARVDVSLDETHYKIKIAPDTAPLQTDAEVMLVKLLREEATDIQGGENKGLSVTGRNIAVGTQMLGGWNGKEESYRADSLQSKYSCAIIVQAKSTGQILGASYCPS